MTSIFARLGGRTLFAAGALWRHLVECNHPPLVSEHYDIANPVPDNYCLSGCSPRDLSEARTRAYSNSLVRNYRTSVKLIMATTVTVTGHFAIVPTMIRPSAAQEIREIKRTDGT